MFHNRVAKKLLKGLYLLICSQLRSQFHQRFTRAFIVRNLKFWCQKLQSCVLCLKFFGAKISKICFMPSLLSINNVHVSEEWPFFCNLSYNFQQSLVYCANWLYSSLLLESLARNVWNLFCNISIWIENNQPGTILSNLTAQSLFRLLHWFSKTFFCNFPQWFFNFFIFFTFQMFEIQYQHIKSC